MFSDDLIICKKADLQEVTAIRQILHDFSNLSGQTPGWHNSSIFSEKISTKSLDTNINNFPSKDLQPATIHLGHPSLIKETKTTPMGSYTINFRTKMTSQGK
jgi:hypothetical protein